MKLVPTQTVPSSVMASPVGAAESGAPISLNDQFIHVAPSKRVTPRIVVLGISQVIYAAPSGAMSRY